MLGGGGHNGAYEVGMLRALFEHEIKPNVVVGTSVGAMNGAAVAASPTLETVERLRNVWLTLNEDQIFGGSILAGAANLVRTRTALHSNRALRTMIEQLLPATTFEELKVPFHCVAASIERAAEHWFHEGPLVDAILASAAVPGVLPPVAIGGEHFVDGGIVNSIPISRAVELGAKEIYAPLAPPKTPVQVALVAFEIARMHRFARDLATLPKGVVAHVLPSGEPQRPSLRQLNYRDFRAVAGRIARAHRAAGEYLSTLPVPKS